MSDSTPDLSETIAEAAAAPKRIAMDGVSVDEHSLRDLIDADQHLKGQAAAQSRKLPLRLFKIRPGGTT